MRSEPSYVRALPPAMRTAVRAQCGGDWTRVTRDSSGGITVHNQPQPDGASPPPRRPRPRSIPAAPEKAEARPPAIPEQVQHVIVGAAHGTETRSRAESKPVDPLHTVPVRASDPPLAPPNRKITLRGAGEATGVILEENAYAVQQECLHGIPPQVPVVVYSEVLAMTGVDLDAAEGVVRQPERVVIAEQTKTAGYPVLRFVKGDAMVVVGFRSDHPSIIAVYFDPKLVPVTYTRPARQAGGGSRARQGVPTSPLQLVNRLQDLGAVLDGDQDRPVVTFEGQALGQVQLGAKATKASLDSDYQRMQRKIDAIRRRQKQTT